MKRSKLSILVVLSLILGLFFSVPVVAQSNGQGGSSDLEKALKYMKAIKNGLDKLETDMKAFNKDNSEKSFSKSNKDLEKLLAKAETHEDTSMDILSSALKLKISSLNASSFVQAFESSVVDLALRYNETATIWYEFLFEYKQTTEKLAREMMLFSDEATDMVKTMMSKVEEKVKEGESGK